MRSAWRRAWAWLARSARATVGIGDYEAYRRHVALHHPGREPLDRGQFVRARIEARYRGEPGARCC